MNIRHWFFATFGLFPSIVFSQIETNPSFVIKSDQIKTIKSPEKYTVSLLQNQEIVPGVFGRILGENPSVTTFAVDIDRQQFVANGLIVQDQSSGFMLTGNAGITNENQFKNLFQGAGINPKAMGGIQLHFANRTKIKNKNTSTNLSFSQREQERERLINLHLKEINNEIEQLQKAGKTSETSEKLFELMIQKQAKLDTLNFYFTMKQEGNQPLNYGFSYNSLGAGLESAKYKFLSSEIGSDTSIYSKKYIGWELFYQYNYVFHNAAKQHTFIHGIRFSFFQKNNISDLTSSFIRQETEVDTHEKEERYFTTYNAVDYANIHNLRISYDMTYMPLKKETYQVGLILGVDLLFHPTGIDNQLKLNGGFLFPFSIGNSENPMVLSAIFSSAFRNKTTFLESTYDPTSVFFSYNLRLTKAFNWKKN